MAATRSKLLILCITFIVTIILTSVAVYAWSPDMASAPYSGEFNKVPISNGIETRADNIKWSVSGRGSMIYEWYQGIGHVLDQTADCTVNSSEGDKLFVRYGMWNIPNSQVFAYNDCDDNHGWPNVNEETELKIYNPPAIVAEQPYHFYIGWGYNTTGVSGEVNISFEHDGSPWGHDWLDKVEYSIPGSSSSPSERSWSALLKDWRDEEHCPPLVLLEKVSAAGLYTLRVVKTCSNEPRVDIDVDLDNPAVLDGYRQHNIQVATNLIVQNRGEEVEVALTFNRPLSVVDVRRIVEGSSLSIHSYIAVGRYPNNDPVMLSEWLYTDNNTIDGMELQHILRSNGARLEGIVTVYGGVMATDGGLGKLLNNSEIFLVDVIAKEVQLQVREELGLTESNSLQISVPAPFWQLL